MWTVRGNDGRWTLWFLLAALVPASAVAGALLLTGAPSYEFMVLVPVVAISVGIVGAVRGRVTRATTDERARLLDLRARSATLLVITLALAAVWAWTLLTRGNEAAEPYFSLLVLLVVSHAVVLMWLKRRS
jgi:uncharacterized membrane protein